jgi:hypothetical protein
MIPARYFKSYREKLGFPSQSSAKEFLSAKDISPGIDFDYIDRLNARIDGILRAINEVIHSEARRENMDFFSKQHVFSPYETIRAAGLLPRLNNQGRRPEEVLFSWLRGYAVAEFFTPSISKIFSADIGSMVSIGEDDLKNIETFKRSPRADLEITRGGRKIRMEIQSGFQGINDIKEHKVREAKRVFDADQTRTVCVHFDLFNGQVAFVRLDAIRENDLNWITRQQMEGQSVFEIDQNYFKWRLLDPMPSFEELEFEYAPE